jgi:hypothetical protein
MNYAGAAARNARHGKTLAVGDRVAFTRLFLQSGGGGYERSRWRGEIVGFAEGWSELATVKWEHGAEGPVNVFNLCKPKSVPFVEV